MKGASESNAWVPVVVAVLGLLAAGIAVRQCGSSRSPEADAGGRLAANGRLADNERGGWIAQSQPRSGGAGAERSRPGGESRRVAASRSSGAADRGAEPGDFAPPRGSARDAGEADFRDTDTLDGGGDDIPAQPRQPPAKGAGAAQAGDAAANAAGSAAGNPGAAPQPGAKPSADKAAASQPDQVAAAADPAKAGAADANGPVFSLPLDKSTQPDTGNNSTIIADGVTFDQNGARFSANSQIFIPDGGNVDPSAGTITFWTLPDWAGETTSDAHYVHLGGTAFENHIDFFKNGRYMRFLFADNSGYEAGGGRDVSDWKPGERHMITGTWGDGITVLYLDGVAVDAHDYSGDLELGPNPPLVLGTGSPGLKTGANSSITNFQIYARALSADEVAALYAQPPP